MHQDAGAAAAVSCCPAPAMRNCKFLWTCVRPEIFGSRCTTRSPRETTRALIFFFCLTHVRRNLHYHEPCEMLICMSVSKHAAMCYPGQTNHSFECCSHRTSEACCCAVPLQHPHMQWEVNLHSTAEARYPASTRPVWGTDSLASIAAACNPI